MVLALAAAFLWAGGAEAQQIGNAVDGRNLAQEWCGSCHMIGPDVRRGAIDLAPPFAEIAADPQTTEFRLRAFLRTPHQRMPNFMLTPAQTDDIVAYILSLRRP
jgi:mono/diheme cytochrome c family protein